MTCNLLHHLMTLWPKSTAPTYATCYRLDFAICTWMSQTIILSIAWSSAQIKPAHDLKFILETMSKTRQISAILSRFLSQCSPGNKVTDISRITLVYSRTLSKSDIAMGSLAISSKRNISTLSKQSTRSIVILRWAPCGHLSQWLTSLNCLSIICG